MKVLPLAFTVLSGWCGSAAATDSGTQIAANTTTMSTFDPMSVAGALMTIMGSMATFMTALRGIRWFAVMACREVVRHAAEMKDADAQTECEESFAQVDPAQALRVEPERVPEVKEVKQVVGGKRPTYVYVTQYGSCYHVRRQCDGLANAKTLRELRFCRFCSEG